MIEVGAARALLSQWWITYDEAEFDQFESMLHPDVTFESRSDSGKAPNEAQLAGKAAGRAAVLAWQVDHRKAGPFPLRHQVTNFYLVTAGASEAEFRSTLLVSKVGESGIVMMSSGLVSGVMRLDEGALKIARMQVVLDKTPSRPLRDVLADSAGASV